MAHAQVTLTDKLEIAASVAAENILENVLKRTRYTAETRDRLAAALVVFARYHMPKPRKKG